ncbi:MAG: hypothetical protein NW214_06835 [Pseudanabaenaceae cyanobacterium bins.39]|nr:hypothetical protein [Pseudanabaenaceae cyanobacterium bins.39]
MSNPVPQKIDSEQIYPCPCVRNRGKLKPIALMDAFGCDHCSLMFEINEDGYKLLQLGGLSHYPQSWQWVGKWQLVREPLPPFQFISFWGYILLAAFVLLLLLWVFNLRTAIGIPLTILLLSFVGLLVWRMLALRQF